jgi:hypothetical protein
MPLREPTIAIVDQLMTGFHGHHMVACDRVREITTSLGYSNRVLACEYFNADGFEDIIPVFQMGLYGRKDWTLEHYSRFTTTMAGHLQLYTKCLSKTVGFILPTADQFIVHSLATYLQQARIRDVKILLWLLFLPNFHVTRVPSSRFR